MGVFCAGRADSMESSVSSSSAVLTLYVGLMMIRWIRLEGVIVQRIPRAIVHDRESDDREMRSSVRFGREDRSSSAREYFGCPM
jgi:hypothetical protein